MLGLGIPFGLRGAESGFALAGILTNPKRKIRGDDVP